MSKSICFLAFPDSKSIFLDFYIVFLVFLDFLASWANLWWNEFLSDSRQRRESATPDSTMSTVFEFLAAVGSLRLYVWRHSDEKAQRPTAPCLQSLNFWLLLDHCGLTSGDKSFFFFRSVRLKSVRRSFEDL